MKYLKYVFLLFGIFELYAAYSTVIQTPQTLNANWGGDFITAESLTFAKAFACGTSALAIISILAFWVKGRMALIALCIGFAWFNIAAGYNCSISTHLSDRYVVGMYAHTVFTILFLAMLFLSFRKSE